jgi:ABC-type phosphate transport system substrate-binding protein
MSPSEDSVQQSRYVPLSRPLFFDVNDQALTAPPPIRQFISNTLKTVGASPARPV